MQDVPPDPCPGAHREATAERSDAARNRLRILTAARALFDREGVESVSMDAIAAEAGVGKGTLFRRFGSKAGLAAALLDTQDRRLQERILFGPPPLGPDAPAADRVMAFFDAYLDLLDSDLELLRLSETAAPGVRYRIGSYAFWRVHLALLLREACPDLDADSTAHLLLAPLDSDLQHALRQGEFSRERVRSALLTLVKRVIGC